jgi:hypothetical protein
MALPKPSSLIQKSRDQTLRIRYGTQQSQTAATIAALSHIKRFRNRYMAMWVAKMWTGREVGISGS